MARSVEDVLNSWVSATTSAAGSKYKQGIASVKVSPTEVAASRVDQYLAGVQRAVSDGSYVNGLRRVSLSDWQQAAINKGASNIAVGVNSSKDKVRRNLAKLIPLTEQIKEQVRTMPKGTLEEGLARVRFVAESMKAAYGKS